MLDHTEINLFHRLLTLQIIRRFAGEQRNTENDVIKACPVGTRHPPSVADSFPEARGLITWLKIIVSDITLETLLLHHTSSLLKHSAGI